MKNILLIVLTILIVGGIGIYVLFLRPTSTNISNNRTDDTAGQNMTDEQNDSMADEATSTQDVVQETETTIGQSVDGRDIIAYHYGSGDREILLVGGIHGGYSGNTSALMEEAKNYYETHESELPENVSLTIVPTLNPDGLAAGTGATGRFNAHDVDLNRNFDCQWQSTGTWQNQTVDAGSSAFSEPESAAIRDYIESHDLAAAVIYYSAAGGVYASSCGGSVTSETKDLTNIYADASGYKAHQEFTSYEVTGDMVNWLAKIGVPGISVLLTNHTDTEWSKNRAGIAAVIAHYAE